MTHQERLTFAKTSLLGLSIGDAFGETFFGEATAIAERIQHRELQPGQWFFTDDTVMSIGIYRLLADNEEIDQDLLAKIFADNYTLDNDRGYGGTAHGILRSIAAGNHWKDVSSAVFDGMGSMGNGAAMRSGPVGAYFHEHPEKVVTQAALAAAVTHSHPEAIAGAVAIALAACICAQTGWRAATLSADAFFSFILSRMPDSDVKYKINKAATLPASYDIRTIVSILGNGTQLTAQDTVPFALWCAAHHTSDFAEAIWTAVSGLGDRDTIAAMVGSIVVLSAGEQSIPPQWIAQTERFDRSLFW